MMPQLHETPMGRKFFESDIPKISKALTRIADALEKIANSKEELKCEDSTSQAD